MSNYFDKVQEIIINVLNVDRKMVTRESTLKHDLGVDSMDSIDIIMALEKEFNIDIDENHLDQFIKVEDFVSYIQSNI